LQHVNVSENRWAQCEVRTCDPAETCTVDSSCSNI
jgi:hypothetical protein